VSPKLTPLLLGALIGCMLIYHGHMIPAGEAVVMALLLVATSQTQSVWTRILDWAPLSRLGKCSYSIYIWQQLMFLPGAGVGLLLGIPVILFFSYRVERLGIRLGAKIIQKKMTPKSALVTAGSWKSFAT
jgi:peptidoglycan/LPS O-acetylase OafA/YrhL